MTILESSAHSMPRRRQSDSITAIKILKWIAGILAPIIVAGLVYLASQIATKGDLREHVLTHAAEREADNSVLQLFMARDAIWKTEQERRSIQECRDHGHHNCSNP